MNTRTQKALIVVLVPKVKKNEQSNQQGDQLAANP